MSFFKKIALLILIIAFANTLSAQEQKLDNQDVIESIIEEIAASTDAELDYTSLYDDLYFFYENPLNLNTATEEQLNKLQFLNDFQIKSILNYRYRYGKFVSIYELQLLYGFTPEIINNLLPFVIVKETEKQEKYSFKKAFKYGHSELFIRTQKVLEKQVGFLPMDDSLYNLNPNSKYLGNALKIYTKYKYSYRDKLAFGMTMEKDPGEQFFRGNQKYGFDYYSAFLQINDFGKIKSFVAGDYKLKFGQGLVLWSGISSGKSSYVLNAKKKGTGLSKYSSTDENKFFRGAATTISLNNFDVTVFVSHKSIDANIDSVDSQTGKTYSFSSLQNSGYHTIPNEIYDKDAVKETVFGGDITYTYKNLKTGLTFIDYSINAKSNKNVDITNVYDSQIGNYSNLGWNYQFYYKNFDFFGESSIGENLSIATINGIMVSLSSLVYLSAIYRYFQNDFYSYYGNAFSEGSKPANENGLYYGVEIYPYRNWKLSAYYDSYEFPWLKSGAFSPSYGNDYLLQLDYSPSRYVNMYIRYKNETKQVNDKPEEITIPTLIDQNNQKLRYHISYKVADGLTLKNRLEFSSYSKASNSPETGFLIYQDVNYRFPNMPVNLSFRYAMFDTKSFNSRIYAYENDVLYAFSIPAYYDKGTRTYLTLKYTVKKGFDIWIRIAQTYFADKDHVGSGLNEISGKTKTDAKIQIRYKF